MKPMSVPPRTLSLFKMALMAVLMVLLIVLDTVTRYEVAAAVFYAVLILMASRMLGRRALMALAAASIAMTALSLVFTPHGNLQSGLINMGISIAAIITTTYLILKMEAARAAAQAAQAQLLRLARIQSLEGLTTSIAHEVNQPLAAIVTSGHACQRWLAQQPPNLDKARLALDRILADAGRASQIIARVHSLARGQPPQRVAFDVNEALQEVLALSSAEMQRQDIRLRTDLAAALPAGYADRVQIQQVTGNLVLNAIEAMAEVPAPERQLHVRSELQDHEIVLSVHDSGPGVAPGVQPHLFDAFWTTKPEGIGVGLSISRTLIEANGGRIWADTAPGPGATFRFSVPLASQESHP